MTSLDPGLQPERTSLSWRRTAWSMLIPALLCLRGWFHNGEIMYALSGVLLLSGAGLMIYRRSRYIHGIISLIVVSSALLLLVMSGNKVIHLP